MDFEDITEEQVKVIMSREDVKNLMDMSPDSFNRWYVSTKEALEKRIKEHEAVSNVPLLGYTLNVIPGFGDPASQIGSYTSFREHLANLREGLQSIDLIKRIKEGYRGSGELKTKYSVSEPSSKSIGDICDPIPN